MQKLHLRGRGRWRTAAGLATGLSCGLAGGLWAPAFVQGEQSTAGVMRTRPSGADQGRSATLQHRPLQGAYLARVPTSATPSACGSWMPTGTEMRGKRRIASLLGVLLGLGLLQLQLSQSTPSSTFAASAATTVSARQHPHLGQKVALFLRSSIQLPDWAILIFLSALPLCELRGGVPVGLWMGLPVTQVMPLCIVGNMIPIPLILLALRSPSIKRLMTPILKRAEKKVGALGAHDRWVGVAAFVGVPLPGTGAWTGAMVAYLLGMEFREAVSSVFVGVCVAGTIMTSLTLAGWYGCAAVVILASVALGSRWLQLRKK